MVFTACGHLKDLLVVELDAGDDLLIKISEACEAAGIKNGFVYGAVGRLQKAAVYTAAPIGVEDGRLKFGYMDEPLWFGGLLCADAKLCRRHHLSRFGRDSILPHALLFFGPGRVRPWWSLTRRYPHFRKSHRYDRHYRRD